MRPRLVVLVGPNGAGKSTLYETRVAPVYPGPFINADQIQRDELQDPSGEASYVAARLAAERRAALLNAGESFATETVFSHPSKLELVTSAQAKGYLVIVMHVGVEDADLSVRRVEARRAEGGHDVPEDKIRARFQRNRPLIRQAVLQADRGMVFDNSRLNRPPEQVLVFSHGKALRVAPFLPKWVLAIYEADLLV